MTHTPRPIEPDNTAPADGNYHITYRMRMKPSGAVKVDEIESRHTDRNGHLHVTRIRDGDSGAGRRIRP